MKSGQENFQRAKTKGIKINSGKKESNFAQLFLKKHDDDCKIWHKQYERYVCLRTLQ